MLIIEQNLVKALQIADRGYVLETGKITYTGNSKDILNNPKCEGLTSELHKSYLKIFKEMLENEGVGVQRTKKA